MAQQARYQVRLYDVNGVQTAVFDDWNSLYYYNRVSDYPYHTFSISGDDPRVSLFGLDCFVQVLRSIPSVGLRWYTDYFGFHRTSQFQISDKGHNLFISYGRGFLDLVHRRHVLYPAGTLFDSKSGPADDVAKQFVRENATVIATTANGRIRTGTIPGFNVNLNIGAAPAWSGSAAFKNLLDAIQEISKSVRMDFDVIRTGPTTFQFETYVPRRGTDRTGGAPGIAPMVFAVSRANMSQPYAVTSRVEEVNTVVVLGQGEGLDRSFEIREDTTTQDDSPWNTIEKAHDARNETTIDALRKAGDEQLNKLRATRNISFTPVQTDSTVYGRDFFLGDLVVARYGGLTQNKKIIGTEITMAEGKENLRIHVEDEAIV